MSSSFFLCLRCDLHDLLVGRFQTLSRWFMSFHNARIFLDSSLQFPGAPSASLFLFARHCRLHWNFQLFSCVFDAFLCILHLPDRWNKCLSVFERCRALVFRSPILAFLLSCFSHARPNFRPQIIRSDSCSKFCWSLPGPHVSLGRVFFPWNELRESFPRFWQTSIHVYGPVVIKDVFLAKRPDLYK